MKQKTLHLILIILFILSLISILWNDLGLLPSIPINVSIYRLEKINSFISNISISIVSSILFYFLLIFIPIFYERKKLSKIIQINTEDLYKNLEILESYFFKNYNFTLNGSVKIYSFKGHKYKFKYFTNRKRIYIGTPVDLLSPNIYFEEYDFFKYISINIIKNIDLILSNPMISSGNQNFILLLFELKSMIIMNKIYEINDTKDTFDSDYSKSLNSFFLLKNKLNEYMVKENYFIEKINLHFDLQY